MPMSLVTFLLQTLKGSYLCQMSFPADTCIALYTHGSADVNTALVTQAKREAVTAVYEARPMPKDHQVPGMSNSAFNDIS